MYFRGAFRALLPLTAISLGGGGLTFAQGVATYTVTFTATWSAATHPSNFPSSPHFSGLIGGTHSSAVSFWATGSTASLGIKNMAELGTKAALRSEVTQAIQARSAEFVLSGGGIGNSPGTRRLTFDVSDDFPLVTLVSMLAPSPDWFVGVHDLSLLEGGEWVDSLTVDLIVYDAGTDSGSSYTSGNNATDPQEPIARIESDPFLVDGQVKPVGTFVFRLDSFVFDNDGYYTTIGPDIVDPFGNPVYLHGVGLGGWLVPEGYMLHINAPDGGSPRSIRAQIVDLIGEAGADEFFEVYQANYVEEKDIAAIKSWGFDHIRLPFHYAQFYNSATQSFREEGFTLLDTFLEWCRTHELLVILDMHAAPGAQSEHNISDSDGEARLWTEPETYWPQTVAIWKEIARRYADERLIVGYDLINEPVTPDGIAGTDLRALYERLASAVREVDPNHILFIEGNYFATTFPDLLPPFDDNMVYAFHKYWNGTAQNSIQYLLDIRAETNTPLWLGETGENSNVWFHDVVRLMEVHGIGWNWWTHKKIDAVTSPLSVPFAPGYAQVVDYWRGAGPRPTEATARQALLAMAQGLDMDNAVTQHGVLAALFDPDFSTSRTPFKDHVIPGEIHAVDYDLGRQGVTYFDSDFMATSGLPGGGNTGGKYRNDGVDIEISTDPEGYGFNVGWTERLEWLSYTVRIEEAGDYDIEVRVASATGGGQFRLYLDNDEIGDDIEVGSTGGWQNWESSRLDSVALPQGEHELRLVILATGANVNTLRFEKSSGITAAEVQELPSVARVTALYPNPLSSAVRIEFELPTGGIVRTQVFDLLGRRVFETAEAPFAAGPHGLWLRPVLAAGVYMLRLDMRTEAGLATFTEPLVITAR